MAEMIKDRKLTMREILDEIAEDNDFTEELRERAKKEIAEMGEKYDNIGNI